jgi:hypothetical protein
MRISERGFHATAILFDEPLSFSIKITDTYGTDIQEPTDSGTIYLSGTSMHRAKQTKTA